MRYFITFLEGIVSFLSPCMLPLLPAYVGYFAGGMEKKRHTLARAAAFVCWGSRPARSARRSRAIAARWISSAARL